MVPITSIITEVPTILDAVLFSSQSVLASLTVLCRAVVRLVKPYFGLLQQLIMGTSGAKELVDDGIKQRVELWDETHDDTTGKVSWTAVKRFATEIKIARIHIVRGALYAVSGVCGGATAMHSLGMVDVDDYYKTLSRVGNGAFLAGNIITLYFYCEELRDALHIAHTTTGETRERAEEACHSAVMGIVSTLAWLLTAALTAFSVSTAAIIVIGIIGSFTGGIKSTYDFLCYLNHRNEEATTALAIEQKIQQTQLVATPS